MTIYENFNTSRQTAPHFERHESFVSDLKLPGCAIVQSMPYDKRCEYIKDTEDCLENVFIFDYYRVLYCYIAPTSDLTTALGIVVLLMICGCFFIILGTAADKFFCPALTVISYILGLNENVAGVTLLAFGNSAPDLFTNLAGLSSESRRLYSDAFGTAFFVSIFVVGYMVAAVPFKIQAANFLRDACFLLLDVLLVDYSVKSDSVVTLTESILILVLYAVYIMVVILDQYLLKRQARNAESQPESVQGSVLSMGYLESLKSEAFINLVDKKHKQIDIESTKSGSITGEGRNDNLMEQFWDSLNPIDEEDWAESSGLIKAFTIVKVPLVLMMNLLIPVIDFEEENHGWSKLLNCIQLNILPLFCLYIQVGFEQEFMGAPVMLISFLVTLPLSIFIFFSTRTSVAPSKHSAMSFFVLVGSIYIIYCVAAEIVCILDVLGIMTYRSNSFLGCTLLSWGNSLGDLIANVALARQGYHRMGFAACFGGPLFSSLVSIGTAFIYKTSQEESQKIDVREGTMGENCSIFLIIGLIYLILGVSCANFNLRLSTGLFCMTMYVLFFSYSLMGELEIMHPFGTDHSLDLKIESVTDL